MANRVFSRINPDAREFVDNLDCNELYNVLLLVSLRLERDRGKYENTVKVFKEITEGLLMNKEDHELKPAVVRELERLSNY